MIGYGLAIGLALACIVYGYLYWNEGEKVNAVNPLTMTALVLVYLAAALVIGYLGYKKMKSSVDYLVAGRCSRPVIIALSYGATFISTSAIIGFGGQAANLGLGLIWLTVLNIGIGILLAFVLFGKKTREIGQRLSAVTFPDLMCKIYKSPLLQYISGFIIVISMPLYTAAVRSEGYGSSSRRSTSRTRDHSSSLPRSPRSTLSSAGLLRSCTRMPSREQSCSSA